MTQIKVNPAAGLRVWLTCDLSETADEQRLVVTEGEGDAVTQAVLVAVFDLMLSPCVRHTQQVLLQQLWTAQHWTVVRKGRNEPEGQCWERLFYLSEILLICLWRGFTLNRIEKLIFVQTKFLSFVVWNAFFLLWIWFLSKSHQDKVKLLLKYIFQEEFVRA